MYSYRPAPIVLTGGVPNDDGGGRRTRLTSSMWVERALCRQLCSSSTSSTHKHSRLLCATCLRQAEYRATLSILTIVLVYAVMHALSLYEVGRRWLVALVHTYCPPDVTPTCRAGDKLVAPYSILILTGV